jgi:APA family basic amino acid/polyamine antiporter
MGGGQPSAGAAAAPEARRVLSTVQAGALVVGSMIGTGIFTTSGYLLSDLKSPAVVLAVWVVAGVLALAGAAVYGELGAMMPRAGGEYIYLSRAFHPMAGFLSGWISLLVGFSAPMAANALAFGVYAEAVAPGVPGAAAGIALIVAVTLLHARDVVGAGRLQTFFTALNVLCLLGFIVLGLAVGKTATTGLAAPLASGNIGTGALAGALVFVSYSYFGWNAAAYVAGEVRQPQRTLPRALLLGCGLVTLLYVLLNAVILRAVPIAELAGKKAFAHVGASAMFGPRAATVLSALICLVLAASVSALAMTGPRVYVAMAEDKLFFKALARRNAAGAPVWGVLLQGALGIGFAFLAMWKGGLDWLFTYIGLTLSLCSAATVLGAFILRRREPDAPRPFRTPLWPLPAVVFFGFSVWMAARSIANKPLASIASATTVLVGIAFYFVWRLRKQA